MNIKDKLVSETLWALVAKGVAVLGGLFFVIFIPKLASVEIYGQLSLALAYIAIFGMLSGTQINSAVKNEITRHKLTQAISKDFFYEGIKLKLILFACLSLIFVGIAYLLKTPFILNNIGLILVLLILMNTWGLVIAVFESIHQLFFEALLYILEYSLTVGLVIYFYFSTGLTIQNLLYAFICGYAFTLGLGLIILYKKFSAFNEIKFLSWRSETNKILLKRTFFLTLTGLSIILLTKIDSILISFFLSVEDVGFFNIGSDIAKNTVMLSVPIMLGTLPVFFEKKEKRFIFSNLYILAGINVAIFIGLFFFGEIIINKIYGPGFDTAASVIKNLAFYPLFASLQTFIQEILILKDKTKQIFTFGLIAIITDIALNCVLIPILGLPGAAIATTISYSLWFIISFLYIYKNINSEEKALGNT